MSERAHSKSPTQSDRDNTVVVYTDRADCRLEELRGDEGQAQLAELESLQFRYDELLREHDQLRSTLGQLEAAYLDNIPQDKVTDAEAGTLYGELIYAIEQWIYNLSLGYSHSHWQRLYSTNVHGAMEDRKFISLFPKTVQGHTAQNLRDLEGAEHLDLFFMTCFITEAITNEVLEEKHPYGLGREQIKFIEETERSMTSVLKWAAKK
ncbi:hypothetical protein SLS56_011656 [Neofusicoccum ribis]|uniref:Uncharacterized protein n=1 Tax=Neofusicoccum ribis TaxID=45134 RepID=A0ABR3SBE0_9PEZI